MEHRHDVAKRPSTATRRWGWVAFAGFVLCVWGANWMIAHVGTRVGPQLRTLPIGFGLSAPSGTVLAGASFTLRDVVQRSLGPRWTVAGIVVGAALAALFSPSLALASGTTFLVSEGLDFAVYTPLQSRNLTLAVIVSNLIGAVADSLLFLSLAFGADAVARFWFPQTLAKFEWGLPFLPLVWAIRGWRPGRIGTGERS